MPTPLIEAKRITKRFLGVVALDDVSVTLESGQIHCIVGENGAGKSTLVKILTGLYRADAGTLTIEGQEFDGRPSKAIAYVPQELNLFDELTVAENIFMPFEESDGSPFFFNRRNCERAALPYMAELQMEASPRDLVRNISVAERQLLQVARALANSSFRILILDEPTASLTKREIDRLFSVIEALKAKGKAIIFITHRLDEVMHLQDAVTVLRNGQIVGYTAGEKVAEDWIVKQMTGKDIDLSSSAQARGRCSPEGRAPDRRRLCRYFLYSSRGRSPRLRRPSGLRAVRDHADGLRAPSGAGRPSRVSRQTLEVPGSEPRY